MIETQNRTTGTEVDVRCTDSTHQIYREVLTERARAHTKHGKNSIEAETGDSARWLAILTEEVGEVTENVFALALNTALGKVAHACTHDQDPSNRRTELIQVMAVASAWITALDRDTPSTTQLETPASVRPSPAPAPRPTPRIRPETRERSVRFQARFDSTCPACDEQIQTGEDVAWCDQEVVHDSCAIDAGVEVFDR